LGHKDFLERYPYSPDRAKALLKEAGFGERNPLKYNLMTHAANQVLPTIATIIKTQLANSGVEVNVEVLDRPVFLKRIQTHDLDQVLTIGSHFVDPYARAYLMESTGGSLNIPNHSDTHVDALIARDYVKGYVFMRGLKVSFESVWLDR
jgi:ABC-type transport system substrate-binding protein